jgi:hypothetical protein
MAVRRAASRVAGGGVAGEEPSLAWVVAGGNIGARRSAAVLLHLRRMATQICGGRRRVESRTGGWSQGREDRFVIMRNSVIFV